MDVNKINKQIKILRVIDLVWPILLLVLLIIDGYSDSSTIHFMFVFFLSVFCLINTQINLKLANDICAVFKDKSTIGWAHAGSWINKLFFFYTVLYFIFNILLGLSFGFLPRLITMVIFWSVVNILFIFGVSLE